MSLSTPLMATSSWLLASLFLQVPPPMAEPSKSAELRTIRDEILSKERSKLKTLADRLRSEGKTAEADEIAADLAEAPAVDGSSRFVLLAEVVPTRPKGKLGSRSGREVILEESAKALLELAVRASKPPQSLAFADECLRDVIARQPDHAEARRLLGFVPHQGGWATPQAVDMLTRGFVANPTYGWVEGSWVPHLERGELPGPRGSNRWLPAAEADALRSVWDSKWEISTEHFKIYTNVPLNEAISFGRKLEDLHQLFFSMMADVIGADQLPLARRFKDIKLKPSLPNPKTRKYHEVYYFATRDEYATYLAPMQGEGARTSLGTYIPRKESKELGGRSYFFNDVGGQLEVSSTLYHEASHQLLFESAGADDYARNVGQYWVFEGLGTYFETLQHEADGSLRIGGLIGPRIAQARRQLLREDKFVPIEQLVAMNIKRFQGEPGSRVIYLHYAESMALAVFLMQADGGRHREGFLDYVQDAYKGRFRGNAGRTLDDQLGVPYPELNKAFLEYLGRGPKR